MGSSRFVKPETVRLFISQGDWLLVKRRLTAGEQRHVFARLVRTAGLNEKFDVSQAGLANVLAYLIDWSFTDMPIRDQPENVVESALNALDPDDYAEVLAAIRAHEEAITKERTEEKKLQAGASESFPTSPSPSAVTGPTSTSLN